MAETTSRKAAPKAAETTENTGFVREIEADEEIWAKTESEDKGNFLSLEDQIGNVKLKLTIPLELRDQEPVDHLIVRAPTTKEIQTYRSSPANNAKSELRFFGGCCVGIKAEDTENLHGRDWDRLCRLVTNLLHDTTGSACRYRLVGCTWV